jgi:hydroxyacylglutathione hydrolase
VPEGTMWVHCGSGYRAAVAASLLARDGRSVVVIDDSYGEAEAAGVDLVTD